jgi:hypothetical protein
MEIVNFSIDANLNVKSEKPFDFTINNSNYSIHILGEMIGAIIDSTAYDDEGVRNYLEENIDDISSIEKLVRNSIGSFYVIITYKKNIHVLCSYTSPGLIYTKEGHVIHFSNTEKEIFERFGKLSSLNEEILLTTVTSHQILLRPPFVTIFDNISRLPSATALIVDSNLNVELDIQLINEIPDSSYKRASIKDSVKQFTFLLENTVRLIVSYHKKNNKNLELAFSGGIDSSILMVALKKTGLDFNSRHFAYNGIDHQEVVIAERIAKKINTKLFIQEKSIDPNLKDIINLSVSGLGTNVTPYQLNIDVSSKAFGYEKTLNMISGQNADTIYHVDTFAPNSSTSTPVKILRTISKLHYRIMYSDLILNRNKSKWFLRLWPFSVKQKNLNPNLNEFLSSVSIPMDEHVVPLKEKIDKNDSEIKNIVKQNKHRNIFLALRDNFMQKQELLNNPNSLQKLSVIKVFRWYRTINNVPINYHNLHIGQNINRILPFTSGPLVNFFLKRNLSLFDMFFVKRIFYKYFKTEVGKNYSYFCKNRTTHTFILFFKFLYTKLSMLLKRKSILETTHDYSKELSILNKIKLHDKKVLLDHVSNKEIRSYFDSLYKILEISSGNISRNEMMALCRLINLENMLYKTKQ